MKRSVLAALVCWRTLIVVCGIALLLGLGTWQLQRLAWKADLIARITSQHHAPALKADALAQCIHNPAGCEFRKLEISGTYRHDQEAHLYGRTYGGKPVTHLITPLRLPSGHTLLVDRGWVLDKVDIKTLKPIQGEVSLRGYLRVASSRNSFTPDNTYEKKRLFSIEPASWAKVHNIPDMLPFYLVLTQADSPQPFPRIAESLTLGLRNFHLSYAITWYMLALTLLIVYVCYVRTQRGKSAPPKRED